MAEALRADDLREMAEEDLQKKLDGMRDELYHLRYKMHVEEFENPTAKTTLRRNIARILTIMRERVLEDEGRSTSAAEPAADEAEE